MRRRAWPRPSPRPCARSLTAQIAGNAGKAASCPKTGWRRKWRCWRPAPMCARNWTGCKAHVQDARALIASGEAVGRKLDFLAQEFNREANTLCSKSGRHRAHPRRPGAEGGDRPVPRAGPECRMRSSAAGLMLVLSSPSGAGKTTLSRRLLDCRSRHHHERVGHHPAAAPGRGGRQGLFLRLVQHRSRAWPRAAAFLEHARCSATAMARPRSR